jgi:hypothetical protein
MPRLVDFKPKRETDDFERLDDVVGKELTLTGVTFNTGEYGRFAIMDLVEADGVVHTVMTGSAIPLEALTAWVAAGSKPCAVTFKKVKRYYTLE